MHQEYKKIINNEYIESVRIIVIFSLMVYLFF